MQKGKESQIPDFFPKCLIKQHEFLYPYFDDMKSIHEGMPTKSQLQKNIECKLWKRNPEGNEKIENFSFEKVDEFARNCSPLYSSDVRKICLYLNERKKTIEKIRAIFSWICMNIRYDTEGLLNANLNHTVKDVLKSKVAGPDGYSNLFCEMCRLLQIKSIKVKGYCKGFSYFVGKKLSHVNHCWNCVSLQNQWYFVDCLHGSGSLDGMNWIPANQLQRNYYFFTDPKLFVLDHFPTNSKWQLLESPISKDLFDYLVYPQSLITFQYEIVPEIKNQVITIHDAAKLFTFHSQYAESLEMIMQVKPMLSKNQSGKSFFQMNKYTHIQTIGKVMKGFCLFPFAGVYEVKFFFSMPHGDSEDYELSFTYFVISRKSLTMDIGFPKCTSEFIQYGCTILHPFYSPLIRGSTIRFQIKCSHFQNVGVLINGKWSYLKRKHSANQYFVGDVHIKSHLKDQSDISLQGYVSSMDIWIPLARYDHTSKTPNKLIELKDISWNHDLPFLQDEEYVISESERTQQSKINFAKNPFKDIEMNKIFGIKLLSHPSKLVGCKEGSSTIRVQCQRSDIILKPLKLQQYGFPISNDTTWVVRSGEMVYFKVLVPRPGRFLFQIEAKQKVNLFQEPEFEECIALEYEIDATEWEGPTKEDFCFPTPFDIFNEQKCVLYSPFKPLQIGSGYPFRIKIPDARNVAVISNGTWVFLEQEPDNNEIWSCVAEITESEFPSVKLVAQIRKTDKSDSDQFFPFLQFQTVKSIQRDDVFVSVNDATEITLPSTFSQHLTLVEPKLKQIHSLVGETKLIHFKYNNRMKGSADQNFLVKAILSDEYYVVERATLVLNNSEKQEVYVLVVCPRPGMFYLTIQLIGIENQDLIHYDGIHYWINSAVSVQQTKFDRPKDFSPLKPLSPLKPSSKEDPVSKKASNLKKLGKSNSQGEDLSFQKKSQNNLKINTEIVKSSYRSHTLPSGTIEVEKAKTKLSILKEINKHGNQQMAGGNRPKEFGFVKLDNVELYRQYIFYPLNYYLIRDCVHSVKIEVKNTSNVLMCSYHNVYNTYDEFQDLENDDIDHPYIWHAEVSFTCVATHVYIMASVDPEHYTRIGSYILIDPDIESSESDDEVPENATTHPIDMPKDNAELENPPELKISSDQSSCKSNSDIGTDELSEISDLRDLNFPDVVKSSPLMNYSSLTP